MKKLHVGLMAIGMMAAVQTNAQEVKKEAPKQTPEQRFAKLDTNKDGAITLDELKKSKEDKAKDQEARFKKMDADADGKVTQAEFLAKKEMHDAKKEAHEAKEHGDKQIRENAPKMTPEQRFAKMDANGDGAITLDEMKKGKGEEAKDADAKFKKFDTNADGKVTQAEFLAKKEAHDAKQKAKAGTVPAKRN